MSPSASHRCPRSSVRLLLVAALAASAGLLLASPGDPIQHHAEAAADNTPWRLPETPPRCTQAQADSGDVSGCLLAFYNDPTDTGWGAPPAPGVGPGWDWQGYTYNGSAALAGWEATYIASNTAKVAGLPVGSLATHAFARPLFEGFLHEISSNGYKVNGASGYSFRCTSGNGGWSCPSGDPDDLSNHAWGLAIDMNSGTNPIRSYTEVDGKTACQTPIQTDLPRWVIQTAEKWGLYWGGYGWSTGCTTVDTQRSTVYRDPPHFEFRGTPDQADAIRRFLVTNGAVIPGGNTPDPGGVCYAAFTDAGEPVERCTPTGIPRAGWRLAVDVEAPDEAVAAVINLTATRPVAAGHLSTEDCGPAEAERTTSAVNFAAGETSAAMAIVPLDENDRFCVWRSTDVHSIVDVVGYLTDAGQRLWFEPSAANRMTDTRLDGVCTGSTCAPGRVPSGGSHTVATPDAAPRIVNLTATNALGPGHAAAGRCGLVATTEFSNLNYIARISRANMALLDNGADGSCVWVHEDTHIVVDELGRLLPDAGLGWKIAAARRVLDTRECTNVWCDDRPVAGRAYRIDLGLAGPTAITLTITGAAAPGHAWVGGCDELVDGAPLTSSVNYVPGKATANLSIVSPDDGEVCLWLYADAHVVIDARAELVADRTIGLRPTTPDRVHDSRDRD